jgi:N-acetylmuramoyl-L-alanine amidase
MKKTFKILGIVLILIVLLAAYNFSIAATGKVNENNIRMRKEANTTSAIITNLYKNDEVEVLEKTGDWYKIKYEGKVGYMRSDLIDITSGTVVDAAVAASTAPSPTTTQTAGTTTTETTTSTTAETATSSATTAEKKEYTLKVDTSIKTYPVMYARNKMDVKKGEKVEKKEELGKWIKVKKDTSEGWILSTEIE